MSLRRPSTQNAWEHFPDQPNPVRATFYDEVLEYRVWMHPERGAAHLAGDADYFAAFARYENALAYSKHTDGAEQPLVLIRQRESVDEPSAGVLVWNKAERLTEWQVAWLNGSHRESNSIEDFLAKHQESRPDER